MIGGLIRELDAAGRADRPAVPELLAQLTHRRHLLGHPAFRDHALTWPCLSTPYEHALKTFVRVLDHSPAEHIRRPSVPPESPTLGLTHLQFEAMLTAARDSANTNDFALVAMLGLLGLRIFEATGADITDLGEEHRHRVLRVVGKRTKVVLVPLPPAVARAIGRGDPHRRADPAEYPRSPDGPACGDPAARTTG